MARGRSSHRVRQPEKPWNKMSITEKEQAIKMKQMEIERREAFLISEEKRKRRNTFLVALLVLAVVIIIIVCVVMAL